MRPVDDDRPQSDEGHQRKGYISHPMGRRIPENRGQNPNRSCSFGSCPSESERRRHQEREDRQDQEWLVMISSRRRCRRRRA
jgi:hypothetical protein